MRRVDAAVIGFGKGGKTLASALAAAGKTVALVEKSPKMCGGTCINVACIPTKSLVHSAALSAAQGGTFSERAARYATAIDEKDRVTGLLRSKNYRKLADLPNVEVVDGAASFADATHLTVAKPDGTRETIEAAQAFINTGARPFVPPIPGVDGPRVHVSETLLDVRTLPERLVIIGGGYIGMEFASMYANFGSQVTVVQNEDAFLPREDAEIAAAVLDSVEGRGIRVIRGAGVRRIDDEADQAVVTVEISGAEERLPADAVLVATGRRPNVDGLNLEAAGAELTERGAVRTNEHLRTTAPNIWAMGDVTEPQQFTYVSYDDYRIVASDVLGDGTKTKGTRGAVPSCIFADPPLAHVGLTEQEARDQGFDVACAVMTADDLPKVPLLGKEALLMKGVVDSATGRVLGIHLYCSGAPEIVNLAKRFLDDGCTAADIRDAVFTHPTVTEELNNLFAKVAG